MKTWGADNGQTKGGFRARAERGEMLGGPVPYGYKGILKIKGVEPVVIGGWKPDTVIEP